MTPDAGAAGEPGTGTEGPVLVGIDVGTSSVRAIAFDAARPARRRRDASDADPAD